MPIISKGIKASSQITSFCTTDKAIAYSTKFHGITLLSKETLHTTQTIFNKHLNATIDSFAFSPNALYLAFHRENTLYVMELQTQKILKTIEIKNATIATIAFDLSSQYLIVATKEGRVLQYKYNDSRLLARVNSYKYKATQKIRSASLISTLCFYKEYLITAYFEGTIEITNLYSKVAIASLKSSRNSLSTLCMIDSKTLLIGTQNGQIYIQDIYQQESYKEVSTPFNKILHIVPMKNANYALVSSSSNTIALLDIKKAKIVHTKYVQTEEDIAYIALLDENRLALALLDNTIVEVELPSIRRLKSLMLHNSLDKAYALVEKNHMLYETQEYNSLQLHYRKTYLKALEALVNENTNEALSLIDIFKDVTSKKLEIQALFKAFESYPRFKSLILEGKYALAYTISSTLSALQLTPAFRKMEKIFTDIFLQAQREILIGKKDNAKQLLKEFIRVETKKELVKLILNDNKLLIEFLQATEMHDFEKVHELASKNSILMQVPSYRAIENSQKLHLQEIEHSIHKGEIQEAKNAIDSLIITPSIASQVQLLIKQCEDIGLLHIAYENSDFAKCYEIIDSSHHLSSSKLTMMLESHWANIIQKAENFALKGNIKGVKSVLSGYMQVSSRKDKIGDLLRVSFHVKITELIHEKSAKSAESFIYSYIDIFGMDSEIISVMKEYEGYFLSKLAITQDKKIPRDNWLNYENIIN